MPQLNPAEIAIFSVAEKRGVSTEKLLNENPELRLLVDCWGNETPSRKEFETSQHQQNEGGDCK